MSTCTADCAIPPFKKPTKPATINGVGASNTYPMEGAEASRETPGSAENTSRSCNCRGGVLFTPRRGALARHFVGGPTMSDLPFCPLGSSRSLDRFIVADADWSHSACSRQLG